MKHLFVLYLFLSSGFAQDLCQSAFKKSLKGSYTPTLKVLERLNRIESRTHWLQRVGQRKSPKLKTYYQERIERDFLQFEAELLKGESQSVVHKMNALFTRVELSALKIKNYHKVHDILMEAHQLGIRDPGKFNKLSTIAPYFTKKYIQSIQSLNDIPGVLKSLQREINKESKFLGKRFRRYEFYQSSLDDLLTKSFCNQTCRDAINTLKKEIGLLSDSRHVQFVKFFPGQQKLKLSQIKSIYNNEPSALLVDRKRELIREGIGAIKRIGNNINLMDRLYIRFYDRFFNSSSLSHKMFKSIFDERYLKSHAHIIRRISHADELSTVARYKLMKEQIGDLDEALFWVDFARVKDERTQRAYRDLREHVSQRGSKVDIQRVQRAENIAQRLGSPQQSSFNAKSIIKLIGAITIGAGIVVYYNFNKNESIIDMNQSPLDDNQEQPSDKDFFDPRNYIDPNLDYDESEDLRDQTSINIEYDSEDDLELEQVLIEILDLDANLNQQLPAKDS